MKHTEWSDVAELVTFNFTQDSQGYEYLTPTMENGVEIPGEPVKRRIFCDFEEGVGQGEFYRSYKAGLQASATLTLWTVDYEGEKFVDFNGKHYSVIRTYVPEYDMTTLVLSEVMR